MSSYMYTILKNSQEPYLTVSIIFKMFTTKVQKNEKTIL